MKIEPGYYKTRSGQKARVLCVDAPGDYPVVGYTESGGEADTRSWTVDGRYSMIRGETNLDIIEPWKESVRVSGWLLFDRGKTQPLAFYTTRKELEESKFYDPDPELMFVVYVTGIENEFPEGTSVGPDSEGDER